VEEMNISKGEEGVIFYDGLFVHVGGINSPLKFRFNTFLEDINNDLWEVVGHINE
jgi:hypothetical protein